MTSDICNACRDGDIELVRVLIETSPPETEINRTEPNESTALHVASYYGHGDIVQLLLDDYGVSRDRKNEYGLTTYEDAATDQIRDLFHQSTERTKRFYSDENTTNPLEVNINESQWLQFHPTDYQIKIELLHEVFGSDRKIYLSLFDWIRSIFGNDPRRKKTEKWSTDLQSLVKECFLGKSQKANLCKLLEGYVVNGEIEYLLRLYTLELSFCEYLAQDQDKTNCLYAPVLFSLSSVAHRAYKGLSFRGLTMTQKNFAEYERALNCHESYIHTKTFCSRCP
ncbi:unnamed protein product [Didymodactylos carnosus]|uniref:Ankyrin repeat protein n=1 Tax=Didymodactylos carnosus TaxID=1234261 RepID=A0A814UDA1_9BILA|nr:unnamed protein product [Didymodactylos carnosus]CAF3937204.1 unnamed protein product [Didymodactylos carnosus]